MSDDTFVCDFCEVRHPMDLRHVVALPRPSDPDELVAVMWGCGACKESTDLPLASDIFDAIDASGEWQGTAYLWVTV